VEDGVIVGVEPGAFPPDGCEVVDLPGTSLLPGLIDTHVHLCADSGPAALDRIPELDADELQAVITAAERQHLRAGVTAVRDLGDHRWAVVERSRLDDGGPTVVASGPGASGG
jgi:imidazolonepropionase-like amidohydrolase